jgi:antirestriction protein ArdC
MDKMPNGVVPCHFPWSGREQLPRNAVSQNRYSGINPFLLNCAGFSNPNWVTFKQAKELGGNIKVVPLFFAEKLECSPQVRG